MLQLIFYGRLNPNKVCGICPQYQILQNSAEIGEFRSLTQNSAFHGKRWSLHCHI